jgi:hypothetical protein
MDHVRRALIQGTLAAMQQIRLVVLLAAMLALLAAGCDDGGGSSETTTQPPSTETNGETTASPASVRIYLTRGETIGPAGRTVETPAVLRGAIEELLRGPTEEELGWGLSTSVPSGVSLRGVSVVEGTATIDLSGTFDDGGGSAGMFVRLAQLVYTATQFPTVERVALQLDGKPAGVFSSEGIELPPTMARADVEDQTPAILVESPLPGETVTGPLTVRGTANTFEATLEWELLGGDGARLDGGFTTATCGTGCRGTFSIEKQVEGSGPATLRLFERSAADGSETKVVEIPIVLTGT